MKTFAQIHKYLTIGCLLMVCLWAMTGCSKFEDPPGPVILTGTVVDYPLEGGVIIHGRLHHTGQYEVIDYGFRVSWREPNWRPQTTTISMKGTSETKDFSLHLSNGFPDTNDKNYRVQTYIITTNLSVRGQTIVFSEPENSIDHVIDDFYPVSGSPGDTLTITGKHFGWPNGSNRVYLGKQEMSVISSSPWKITARVPAQLEPGYYTVSLEVGDLQILFIEYQFQLME